MSNLDPNLGVLAGLECLSDDQEHLQEYVTYLEARYPDSVDDIRTAVDCFNSTQNAYECVFGSFDIFRPSLEEKGLCEPIVGAGESSINEPQLNLFWQALYDRLFSSDSYNYGISRFWRTAVNELISFYFNKIPYIRWEIEALWRNVFFYEQLARYDEQIEEPSALEPFSCPQDDSLERHELIVNGVPYTIPVFTPVHGSHPWEFYETDLLYVFHVLKTFLSPEDLNHILRPGGGHNDLSIYFWSDIAGSGAILHACLNSSTGGDGVYQDDRNTVLINAYSNDPIIGEGGPYLDEIEVELHEIAHALHNLFPIDQTAVEEFYQWSKRQAEFGNSLGYGPATGPEDQSDDPHHMYSFRDSHEFFAEMVVEYFIFELMSTSGSTEMWNDMEMTPPKRARINLMRQFFEGGEIHPETLSYENIRHALQDEGISYNPQDWYPEERVEWIMNTDGEMGALIFIGERTANPPFDFGLGGVLRIESPLDYNPVVSFEVEGTFRLDDYWNFYPNLSVGAEAVLRMGIQLEDKAIAPVISMGMRFTFSKFISYASGFHLIAGFFKEMDFLNGEYPFYGTLGLGYDF